MIRRLSTNWSMIRAVRLLIGIFLTRQSIEMSNYWLLIPSLIFVGMALFNTSCCGNNCAIPTKSK